MAQPPYPGMGARGMMGPGNYGNQYPQGNPQQQQQQQNMMGPPMNPGMGMGPPQASPGMVGMSHPQQQGPAPQQQGGAPAGGPGAAGGPGHGAGAAPPLGSPTKEINTAQVCHKGQELVQDIVQKTNDVFSILRSMQLPNGTTVNPHNYNERKQKLDDNINYLHSLFRTLRLFYSTVNDNTASIQSKSPEELIPVENGEPDDPRPQYSESLKYVSEEHRDLSEQLRVKNAHLKEMIDQLRLIIWEINTMIAMRKT